MEKVAVSLEKIDLDYDEEADVLYISFGKPREAKDSIEVEDGVVYRISDNEVVGITIMDFKAKHSNNRFCQHLLKRAVAGCGRLTSLGLGAGGCFLLCR